MYLDTPLFNRNNVNTRNKWLRVSYLNNRSDDVTQSAVLYIGENDSVVQFLSDSFSNPVVTISIIKAKEYFKTLSNERKASFSAIIIDIPLNLVSLEKFSMYLKKNKHFSKTCLIYSSRHLEGNQAKFLKQLDLIDDAVDLNDIKTSLKKILSSKDKIRQDVISFGEVKRKLRGRERLRYLSLGFKKLFDMSIALLIILFLLPLLLVIAIAIKLESKGPVFYSSLRAGRGYKIFKFYKFRSMIVDADKKVKDLEHLNQYDVNNKGPKFFKLTNDPRVTKVGKFLRNTSLDEIPQLFNVLKGDMSLVGNRPLPLYEAETLTTNDFVERFSAPAGMTGLWQIKKRGKAAMSTEERMELDIIYSRKASPLFDLYIMASTPAALFQKSDV